MSMTDRELEMRSLELRKLILETVYHAKSGHIGGSFSCAEILTLLYNRVMNLDPANPLWAYRDRFVLSKGHATPAYYGALAMRGFFPTEELRTFRTFGARLQGHPDRKHIPGVDMSSGSLGQGISAAVGMALAAKLKHETHRVYALLGDGEVQEGQVWEAFMFAGNHGLDNLCIIIDLNGVQSDGMTEQINSIEPLPDKLRAFKLHVVEADGHNIHELSEAFERADRQTERPSVILAHTVKGKGVSFMEGQAAWHGKIPDEDEYRRAKAELEGGISK